MDFKQGEIIRATKRDKSKGLHYIVVWTDFNEGTDFIGIMLTTSTADEYPDNVPLDLDHIQEGFDFKWKNSNFVNRLFIKFAAWGPFSKVGELTERGCQYLQDNLQDIEPVPFEEYLAERKSA